MAAKTGGGTGARQQWPPPGPRRVPRKGKRAAGGPDRFRPGRKSGSAEPGPAAVAARRRAVCSADGQNGGRRTRSVPQRAKNRLSGPGADSSGRPQARGVFRGWTKGRPADQIGSARGVIPALRNRGLINSKRLPFFSAAALNMFYSHFYFYFVTQRERFS